MLRLTLAQMRRSIGRLTSAGVAIVIGTAFVAATLVAGAVITRTSYDAVAASYADADLVVLGSGDAPLTDQDVAELRALPAVAGADGRTRLWLELAAGGTRAYPEVTVAAEHPRLEAQEVLVGEMPGTAGAVALPQALAERLGVTTGDTVNVVVETWTASPDDTGGNGEAGTTADAAGEGAVGGTSGTWMTRTETFSVSGLTRDPGGAFTGSGGAVVAHPDDAARWAQERSPDGSDGITYETVVVALADGVDVETGRAAVTEAAAGAASVRTKDEQAEAITQEITGEQDVFTSIVLGFAAVALLVAALVITNTFGVLVAQRTRTLALLRCVGADRRQLRRSVLTEAALLGGTASVLGLLLGVGLAQATLVVLGRANLDVPLPSTVSITPAVVLAPLLAGTLVTLVAALGPARAATRVAPLAALRPADAPTVRHRRNLPRLVLATLLTVGGVALLLAAVVLSTQVDSLLALGVGVLGGAASFVGILLGAVFWVPQVVGLAGRVLAGSGTSAKLAAANTVRNPRRTAATSTALLIGVTLVAMMSTGAASARTTLGDELEAQYPVDVLLLDDRLSTDDPPALTDAVVSDLQSLDGVAATARAGTVELVVAAPDGTSLGSASARAVDPTAVREVMRAPDQARGLGDGGIVVSTDLARSMGITDGAAVSVSVAATGHVDVNAHVTDLPGGMLITTATLDRLGAEVTGHELWIRLDDSADPANAVADIQQELSSTPVQVSGAALERVQFQSIIDTLLAVVVGLLAAAVLIALVGVANTLSLSVIERRRESATLRAIGLSRRQLRASLAIEGMLIAGVGAVLGCGLGLLYGWAGAATVLSVVGDVRLDVPWRDLVLVVLVALVAGLLASVVPGRGAARTPPVQALAVD